MNFKPPKRKQATEENWTFVFYTLSVSIQSCHFFYFIASVTINVGHLQRWKPAASSVNQSLQQRDKEIITNSLSKKIIVATL